VEALVRWQHPRLGLLTPDRFFAAAQHSGHLALLDRWVLDRACTDLITLRSSLGGAAPMRVNVNLSAPSLATDLTELVTTALDRTGLPARRLRLELCEGADLETLSRAGPHLERLIQQGIGVTPRRHGSRVDRPALPRPLGLAGHKDRQGVRDPHAGQPA
jgi:EAL domain-containing protein (putative c-di-GMP-specific phosphodiesterase class I)